MSAKREYLARIHGRYQRAGRPHKQRILEKFYVTAVIALRLLNRPLRTGLRTCRELISQRRLVRTRKRK